jgi:formate dehydrogenase gamma subunit
MMIDLETCVGCKACVTSCKQKWGSGPGAARCWVHDLEQGIRGKDLTAASYPGLCMQCEDHPCTEDCPTGATYVDAHGVVVVDPDVCIGCGNCISMCPYGARRADPVKGIVEKCNLCAPLFARGEQPACVATCLSSCRHVGDLDNPDDPVVKLVADREAKPLVTPDVNVRPKVTYAGETQRAMVLASGAVRRPERSWLTETWSGVTLPLARHGVPAFALLSLAGATVVNFMARRQPGRKPRAEAAAPGSPPLVRHRLGMRFLHWFNLVSWVLLLATGTALMSAKSFALFGTAFPAWLAGVMGGVASMLKFHAVWGILWALVIVPLFLLFKRGGREALQEVMLTRDDVRWLFVKPLAMLGMARAPLPPQDKYNAGQKIFALSALAGTTLIIASGVVMTFHLGSAAVVAASILVHKLSIALALVGLSVHVTMAALIRDERPALRAMLTGTIDREHALHHARKWVEEVEGHRGQVEGKEAGKHE